MLLNFGRLHVDLQLLNVETDLPCYAQYGLCLNLAAHPHQGVVHFGVFTLLTRCQGGAGGKS